MTGRSSSDTENAIGWFKCSCPYITFAILVFLTLSPCDCHGYDNSTGLDNSCYPNPPPGCGPGCQWSPPPNDGDSIYYGGSKYCWPGAPDPFTGTFSIFTLIVFVCCAFVMCCCCCTDVWNDRGAASHASLGNIDSSYGPLPNAPGTVMRYV